MTSRVRNIVRIFAAPALLAAVMLVALLAGLVGPARFHPLVWAGCGLPLLVAATCLCASRGKGPGSRR